MQAVQTPRGQRSLSLGARVRRAVFRIPRAATLCDTRGFQVTNASMRERIERIGDSFVAGYDAAMESSASDRLAASLATIDLEFRGFAYEGAAMALALLDAVTLRQRGHFEHFLHGIGEPHTYMALVGSGWAFARIGRTLARWLERCDPLLRWLVVDGYGFHEGYFHWPQSIGQQAYPSCVTGYARRAFDQGLGRSMWFVFGGDVERFSAAIGRFAPERWADLWSGVGLACGYAGSISRTQLVALRTAADSYRSHLAQGVAFAAKARLRAGNPAAHTDLACIELCGRSSEQAAALTDEALVDLPPDGRLPAYEIWRERIRRSVADERGI